MFSTAWSDEKEPGALANPALDLHNPVGRALAVQRLRDIENAGLERARTKASALGIPMRRVTPVGTITEIVGLDANDRFIIYTTDNVNAAISTAANLVQASPYNLNGSGVTVGVWDGGGVRTTHQEFTGGRAVIKDGAAIDNHATHVAGTIAAAGISATAKGMATNARIDSYNWTSDTSEMTGRGATAPGQSDKIHISNHSYGTVSGWNGTEWTGTGTDQNAYEPFFGQYNSSARSWDDVAFKAPYYLIFKSAGNDNSNNPSTGSSVIIGGVTTTYNPAIHPPGDGLYRNATTNSINGYENISTSGNAKNIMTVGAANDAVTSGLRDPSKSTLTTFSSRGPTDDGRIKPDIVANGASLTSSTSTSDTSYGGMSGTSMSGPNAAGSAALLVHHYANLFSGGAMRASTLKGLILHTATDIGNPGPDYHYGWGLMNTKEAADLITDHQANPAKRRITEDLVTTSQQTKTYTFNWDGNSALRATLCWTDPPGASTTAHDLRTSRLINNLDIKLIAPNGTQYYPYTMPFVGTWTVASMSQNATTGINNTDNVEQVYLQNPAQTGTWQAVVTYQGTLTNNQQNFSLLLSGVQNDNVTFLVSSMSPTFGTIGTTVTADITGVGLGTNTQIRLTRAGSTDIPGTSLQMVSANTLRCQFNLAGVTPGFWNLAATSPTLETSTLTNAFDVRTTLELALDTTGINWTSSGNLPWFPQTTTTQDGVDAAQSGTITDNQTSSLSTTLTGPGTLTFYWKVSSESSYDFLRFFLNGVEQTGSLARIAGEVNWIQKTVSIPSGSTSVEWRYTKDGSVSNGSDAAWVDRLVYTPANGTPVIAVEQPTSNALTSGISTVNFGSVLVGSPAPLTFTIRNAGTSTLENLALAKSGTHNTEFALGTLGATSLAPGATTTFTVTFTPAATGTRTAAVQIASNDPATNPFIVNLTGNGAPPGTLFVTPVDNFVSAGYPGGPFSPSSMQYTLSNTGGSAINWTAGKSQTWVTLSATSGTLAAGASTTVTASINTGANSLPVGPHTDLITFTNTTNGNGTTTRDVLLSISGITFTNIFTQNFDSSFNESTSGWTKNPTSGTTWSFQTNTANSHTPGSFYTSPVPNSKVTSSLTTPSIAIPADATVCRISFHHHYDLQSRQDGGRMQLSLDGGSTWHDVGSTQVASNFLSNAYNDTIKNTGNPNTYSDYDGLQAWTGSSGGYLQTLVELTNPAQYQGQNLRLRWTIATNGSTASTHWRVDTVNVEVASPPGPGVLAITPDENFNASGGFGGTFTPASKQYTLENTGGFPINWTASQMWNWLDVTPASGTLAAGATAIVSISFNANANTLEPGSHLNTVTFSNSTNGFGDDTRDIQLTVVPPGTLAVTPADTFISSGLAGGTITPDSRQYTLQNTGTTPINWSATKTQPWLDLDVPGGTLEPGQTAIVEASYNTAANSLPPGKHEDTITFTNTTNGFGTSTRAVELNLAAPGSLTVTGSGGLTSSGTVGGTFLPASVTYTLANPGTTPVDWSATKSAAWLNLSPISGTIPPGGTTLVSVTINGTAGNLAPGSYSDTIHFINNTNGTGTTSRPVVLTVNALVTYNANGNDSGTAPANQVKIINTDLSLATNTGNLAKIGFSFAGWNTAPDGTGTNYPAGAIYSQNASLHLFAKWSPGSDGTWLPTTAGPFNWADPANWSAGNVAAGTDRTALFTPNIAANQTVNLDAPRTIGNITFTDSSSSTNDLTLSGANILTLSRSSGIPLINVTQSGRKLTISSELAGTGGLQKTGPGNLTLAGANSFTGDFTYSGGTLATTSPANLGAGASLTFQGTSTWSMGAADAVNYTKAVEYTAGSSTTHISGNAAKTISGIVSGSGTAFYDHTTSFIWSNPANTFTGNIIAATGNNIFSYGFQVASLPDHAGVGSITLGSSSRGATFRWTGTGGAKTFAHRQFILGGTTNGAVIQNLSTDGSSLIIEKDLGISGTGAKTLTLAGTTGTNRFAGHIADGSGSVISLTKTESSIWRLSGTNTYTGTTTMGFSNPANGGLTFQGIQSLSPNTSLTQTHSGGAGGHGTFRILDDSPTPPSRTSVHLTFNHSNNSQNSFAIFVGNNGITNGGNGAGGTTGATIQLGNMNFNQGATAQTAGTRLAVSGANDYKLQLNHIHISLQAAFAGTWPVNLLADAPILVAGNVQQLAGSPGTTTLQLSGIANGSRIAGNISDSADESPKSLAITKSGNGDWTLAGTNTYTGTTTVTAGKLFINGNQSAAIGDVSVAASATLGGKGTIGGHTTIAATGRLEFDISTPDTSHDKLELATGKSLTFSGSSVLTITTTGAATPGTYTLVTAPGGITGVAPATLSLPANWSATTEISGNNLLLHVTSTGLSPFQIWTNENQLTGQDSQPNEDPEGDGITNLQEFAFGLDPNTPSAGPIVFDAGDGVTTPGMPVPLVTGPGQASAVFGRKKNHAAAGLSYLVEFTADLQSWHPATTPPTPLTNHPNDEVDAVSVPFPAEVPSGEGLAKPTFFRVGVILSP
jgi:autotransporter-associated beta strand protein